MAGGEGKRLDPFTRILPKPLIPLGDEPIIMLIMKEFAKFGMKHFNISLNDKGRMIKAYFHDHEMPFQIDYIEEDKPLGTAGALKYMSGKIDRPMFVSNCDIIVRADYTELLKFHNKGEYDLTLVASMRHFVIPYGVCEVGSQGDLIDISEKPEYDFLVNTGLYLLNPETLNLIPNDRAFDMTDLITEVRSNNMKVGVFPVSEKSWADIGQWTEYRETIKTLSS
jgi:NDP-sugar pyrophosphorylase family protein